MTPSPNATPATPRKVFDQVQLLIRNADIDGFVELFAREATMDYPFAPTGSPRRLQGREEIRSYLTAGSQRARQSGRRIKDIGSVVVHETADPEVIVVEFDQREENVTTGRTRQVSFVHVIRVRDGKVVSYRDYIDYPAVAEMTAGPPL